MGPKTRECHIHGMCTSTTPPLFGVGMGLRLVAACRNSNRDMYIYSNKKDTSDFHSTVSFDPIKMSQQNIYQNVYQTSDIQKLVIN